MKRMLIFSLAAAAAMSAATTASDALAWDTGKPADVFIVNGYYPVCVGRWFSELLAYNDQYGYEACSYYVKWVNKAILPIGANLWLDELITVGFGDCWLNSCSSFPTLLFLSKAPAPPSVGFDKFQQKQFITDLMLTTDGLGHASGIITYNGHFPYSILVKDP